MSQPLILRCSGWPELLAQLGARAGGSYLRDSPPPAAQAVLVAPAAIARWIATRGPQLRASPILKLLVIGAQATDAPDQGRWYQLLPQLLDAQCEVRVTLVGPELDLAFESRISAWAPPVAAQCARARLDEFIGVGQPQFDLAVVFHPGLQKHRGWLAQGGFARLLEARIPLVASSYESDEFEMDRWVLECYGYRASAEPMLNPFFLELGNERTQVRWGRALWEFESAPPPAFEVDREKLDALDSLTRMVMHSMLESGEPAPAYGALVHLESVAGTRRELIHIFDHRFVNAADGRALRLMPDGRLVDVGAIPADACARYPGPAARDIERAIWAAAIKQSFLLGSYPPQSSSADFPAAARSMLDAMREKAAGLFRK